MAKARFSTIKIEDSFLFAIDSPKDAARRLKTSLEELRLYSNFAGNYRLFSIKGDGKKLRKVQEPKLKLQTIHRRVARLLARVETPAYLHSAVKGRSYITNACKHVHKGVVLKLDVKDFFNSASRANVFNFLVDQLKCRRDSAGILADVLTFENHLATGSSASPIISYYCFKSLFDELEQFAITHKLAMTCYIDDLTFSGPNATREMLWQLRLIIKKYRLKSHKARFFRIGKPRVITGVCITDEGIRVPYSLQRRIASAKHLLKSSANEETKMKAARQLVGRLDAAGQIEANYIDQARQARVRYAHFLCSK